ncbi:uncharacterized protein LOC142333156 [Lycorma delicatula]|uniref:uncharacterized protein LOC142333156 n=1 Tax=Lycorma delicatula TaxID=130591 RepID=UPI003F516437
MNCCQIIMFLSSLITYCHAETTKSTSPVFEGIPSKSVFESEVGKKSGTDKNTSDISHDADLYVTLMQPTVFKPLAVWQNIKFPKNSAATDINKSKISYVPLVDIPETITFATSSSEILLKKSVDVNLLHNNSQTARDISLESVVPFDKEHKLTDNLISIKSREKHEISSFNSNYSHETSASSIPSFNSEFKVTVNQKPDVNHMTFDNDKKEILGLSVAGSGDNLAPLKKNPLDFINMSNSATEKQSASSAIQESSPEVPNKDNVSSLNNINMSSGNSELPLKSINSTKFPESVVLLKLPNNPVYAVPGIDTSENQFINNSKRAILKTKENNKAVLPASLRYSKKVSQASPVASQSATSQLSENQSVAAAPSVEIISQSSLGSAAMIVPSAVRNGDVNRESVATSNDSLIMPLAIPQDTAPNAVQEPVPCTCGVFLSGQFTRGSSAQPNGEPVVTQQLEQTFACTPTGKSHCTNKCLDALVRHLPNSGVIICGSIDRDIKREKAYLWVKNCRDVWINTNLSSGKEHCCKDGQSIKCSSFK